MAKRGRDCPMRSRQTFAAYGVCSEESALAASLLDRLNSVSSSFGITSNNCNGGSGPGQSLCQRAAKYSGAPDHHNHLSCEIKPSADFHRRYSEVNCRSAEAKTK